MAKINGKEAPEAITKIQLLTKTSSNEITPLNTIQLDQGEPLFDPNNDEGKYLHIGTGEDKISFYDTKAVDAKINNLDYSTTNDNSNNFVSQVTQENGKINVEYTQPAANNISYDNTSSKFTATDVQDAIDEEVQARIGAIDDIASTYARKDDLENGNLSVKVAEYAAEASSALSAGTLTEVLPIDKGGTGADSVQNARGVLAGYTGGNAQGLTLCFEKIADAGFSAVTTLYEVIQKMTAYTTWIITHNGDFDIHISGLPYAYGTLYISKGWNTGYALFICSKGTYFAYISSSSATFKKLYSETDNAYVKKSGDIMTGTLQMNGHYPQIQLYDETAKRLLRTMMCPSERARFENVKDQDNYQGIEIIPETDTENFAAAVRLVRAREGEPKYYNLYGQHNVYIVKAAMDSNGNNINSTYAKKADLTNGAIVPDKAKKLDLASELIGSSTQPVYFSNGVPMATTHTLETSVPSNAVFTDTGVTSVEVTGTGNAITAATYTASTRKLTLTKGATYNNYSLPTASKTQKGGIKVGDHLTIESEVLSVNPDFGSSVEIKAGSFNAYSDIRLKENFQPLKTEKSILDLPTYKFDFINGAKNQIGCKAQDLQEICPEIVDEGSDGYLSIQESKIVYLLLEEVKKLRQEIDELKGDF